MDVGESIDARTKPKLLDQVRQVMRMGHYTEDKEAGKDVRLNLDNARRTIEDLQGRLDNRKKSLQSMRHVTSGTPVVLSGALVLPAGLVRNLKGEAPTPGEISHDQLARTRIELLAMAAVTEIEESQGCHVEDVAAAAGGAHRFGTSPTGKPSPHRILHRGCYHVTRRMMRCGPR